MSKFGIDAVMRTVNRLGMRDRILINSFDTGRLARPLAGVVTSRPIAYTAWRARLCG